MSNTLPQGRFQNFSNSVLIHVSKKDEIANKKVTLDLCLKTFFNKHMDN